MDDNVRHTEEFIATLYIWSLGTLVETRRLVGQALPPLNARSQNDMHSDTGHSLSEVQVVSQEKGISATGY